MARHPSAFTMVELLVVIGILAVLMGLLVPAVQKVRDAAARVQCAHNLRQLGLAAHHYHDAYGGFPPGMDTRPSQFASSWLTKVLPYLEQETLWSQAQRAYGQSSWPLNNPPHMGLATVVPAFACPSDSRVLRIQVAQREGITVALTSYLGVEGRDLKTRDGVLFRDSGVRIADIRDGTANTLFAGERPPSSDLQFGWWYAGLGQDRTGSGDMVLGAVEQNLSPFTATSVCPTGTYSYGPGSLNNVCDLFHFWSLHSGQGANFLVADGSVRFVGYSAARLLPALATRAGGEIAGLDDL